MTESATEPPLSAEETAAICDDILTEISEAVIASERFFETVLAGVLAEKHVLIEDVPGTGKTLTARTLADVLGLEFNRIQFTPDLLPSDISGSMVFDDQQSEFRFNRGPIFANILLADEINRAPPKTQAALLEAMEENQVSVGDQTRKLPEPFFVIATQNPVEQEGTFELPESQLDRFMIKTEIGYPDRDNELELLDRRLARMGSEPTVDNVIDPEALAAVQSMPEYVHVAPEIRDYILDVGRATREHEATDVGVSPRGIERYMEAVRAWAVIRGREYVVPKDVKSLATPVLAHRLVLRSAAIVEGTSKQQVVEDILDQIDVPSMDVAAE
jgi:MoxR-like ATPase